MSSELISVVIPTYNRARTLRRAIESVLDQSHSNVELIVVDDASTDDSDAVLATIRDPRLRVIRHERNKGVAGALNTGLRLARGDYIAIQDSDDEWLHDKLVRQMDALRAAPPDCVCVYCIKIVYGRDRDRIYGKRRVVCVPGPEVETVAGDLRTALQRQNIVSTQTILCRRDAALRAGGFDERLRNSVDWDFVSRLAEIGPFAFVDEPLVNTYIQKDSISTLSRKGFYSQLRIVNKMKRRGVPAPRIAEHLTRLGYGLGKSGLARRGGVLLRAALKREPTNPAIWIRLAVNSVRQIVPGASARTHRAG